MKYFKIKYSLNNKIIGDTYPQCQNAIHKITIDDENHIWNQEDGFLKETVSIPDIKLSKLAKQTDLLSDTILGGRLLISNKLKNLIEKYSNVLELQFLNVNLIVKNQYTKYWILNPLIYKNEFIDFENSSIWIEGLGNSKINKIDINNYNEYNNLKNSLLYPERISIHYYKLIDKLNQNFFQLANVKDGNFNIVSEKLKNEIENENCTGIEFELIE